MTDPRRGQLPRGLLGMLALVLLVEAFIARRDMDYTDLVQWNWRLTGKQAAKDARGFDVLCLGDSLMKLGVVPRLVESRSGRCGYNLAISGGQAPATYFALRRALESGARPSAVVVNFFPRLMELGPRHNLANWSSMVSPRECLELCWSARDAGMFATIMSAKALPSLRARHAIRADVLAALAGRSGSQKYGTFVAMRNWKVNDGAQVSPCNMNPTQDFVAWRQGYFSRLWADPVNVSFLHRFLKKTASEQIPVFWLVPPMKPALQAEVERGGFDAEYTRFLGRMQARFPHIIVVDGRRAGYDPKVFFDPHHLGREGAYVYSLALGDVLRRRGLDPAAGPRWIELPAYREPPPGIDLEDIAGSQLALKARYARRR